MHNNKFKLSLLNLLHFSWTAGSKSADRSLQQVLLQPGPSVSCSVDILVAYCLQRNDLLNDVMK